MLRRVFAPVSSTELERITTTLVGGRVFADADEVREAHAATPWRIQTTRAGDIAVLDRWRDHLDMLAVEALWCAERGIPDAMRQLRQAALSLGYRDLLGPPAPLTQVYAYEAAGMHVRETASMWTSRVMPDVPIEVVSPAGVVFREGDLRDLSTVLAVDTRCFDDFWRYDPRHLRRLIALQRLVIAEGDGEAIGYTLSTTDHDVASLGRLGVVPEWRRRGVGRMLATEVMRWAGGESAARLNLCTQSDNAAARGLYRILGFREAPDRFAFLQFE
jgi:ribosomal protein S18 acetylase RimI-like enzyme